jgi:outer membrane protein
MKSRLVTALSAAALVAGAAWPARGAPPDAAKVGVVDFQRCIKESKVGKQLEAEFSVKAQKVRAEFEKKETALKELRETIDRQGLVLSPGARAEKEKEFNEKRELFREQFRAAQQALDREDRELTGRIGGDLQVLARKMGEAGGYALIIERNQSGALFVAKEVDLTDELIRSYDREAEEKPRPEAGK